MEKVAVASTSRSSDAETTEEYVYDLYYMNRRDFDFRMLENILAIEAYNIEFEDPRQPEVSTVSLCIVKGIPDKANTRRFQ